MTEEIKQELDVRVVQQPEGAAYDNPLRTNLDSELDDNKTDKSISKKRKDPKIVLLFGLFAFLAGLLILSLLASIFIPKKKINVPIESAPVAIQPTSGPLINRVEIPQIWQEKLQPAVRMLDVLGNLQVNDEFLPPTFDPNIGLN